MSLDMSGFDRSRRTLIFRMRKLPRRIGAVELASQQQDSYPELLAYTRVVDEDGEVYYETNGFEPKYNSADVVADEVFMPPVWGEVEAVQYNGTPEVNDFLSPQGLTQVEPEVMVLHEFNSV